MLITKSVDYGPSWASLKMAIKVPQKQEFPYHTYNFRYKDFSCYIVFLNN